MKKFNPDRLTPPGVPADLQIKTFRYLLLSGLIFSLVFFFDLNMAVSEVYTGFGNDRAPDPVQKVKDFKDLVWRPLLVLLITVPTMLGFACYYYLSYYQHSKSIYLMRRLGKPWLLHLQCWSLPVMLAVAAAVITFAVMCGYFGIYLLWVPEECLRPAQWQRIWRDLK